MLNLELYKTLQKVSIEQKNKPDATGCFIAIISSSTCFWHSYAHYQKLETLLVLLPHMVCNALVAGGRLLGADHQAMYSRKVIIITFIYCSWFITRWKWLFYMYANHKIGYYWINVWRTIWVACSGNLKFSEPSQHLGTNSILGTISAFEERSQHLRTTSVFQEPSQQLRNHLSIWETSQHFRNNLRNSETISAF